MNLIKRLTNLVQYRSNPLENPQITLEQGINAILALGLGSEPTPSGEVINEHLAEQFWAVYTAVRYISEAVGCMPLLTYRRATNGKQEALGEPLHRMLALEPNDEMSAITFWEAIVHNMALTGNGYARILRNKFGEPVQIYPLPPIVTRPVRLDDGTIAYRTTLRDKNNNPVDQVFAKEDVLHFPLMGWDGLKGSSPICHGSRNLIGMARALEKYGSRFFGNGSMPTGGILQPVKKISNQDFVNMRQFWEQSNGGENRSRITLLPNEWNYTPGANNTNESNQFLETRAAIRTEIAALFHLPPHILGDQTRMSNNNMEQESIRIVVDCLKSYTTKIEHECNRKLLGDDPTMFVKFDYSERLRGDSKTTMDTIIAARQWGIYTANEGRELLGMNPVGTVGDILWTPVNMQNSEWTLDNESIEDQPVNAPAKPATGAEPKSKSFGNVMKEYHAIYYKPFYSASVRMTKRDKRDRAAVQELFGPMLDSITQSINSDVRKEFGFDDTWEPSATMNDLLKGIEKRCGEWKESKADEAAAAELIKSVRTIYINASRDAAAHRASSRLQEFAA